MKLKYEFQVMELDDDNIAVPVGEGAEKMKGVLRLNQTGVDILNFLVNETTEDAIISNLTEKYDGEVAEIQQYVREFVETLKGKGIVE